LCNLKHLLALGKQVECDQGHCGDPACCHTGVITLIADHDANDIGTGCHETINGNIRCCIRLPHPFAAAAVLTQQSCNLENGPQFQVCHWNDQQSMIENEHKGKLCQNGCLVLHETVLALHPPASLNLNHSNPVCQN